MPKLPQHIVIIPDGNRRWAREHSLPIWRGHQKGMERTRELLKEIRRLGIQYCTWWGFSTENWNRDDKEISRLMSLFEKTIADLAKDAHKHKISFHHFGRKDRLRKKLIEQMEKLEKETSHYTDYYFGLALDYGGHDELLRAFQKLQKSGEKVSEKNVSKALDTKGFPDPDLIIRTGGEQRVSGIMPWQAAYAELYFTQVYYPEFNKKRLAEALKDFSERQRRFGR